MKRKQTKLWTTKDSSKLRICDMSDEHLLNTIRMLQRFGETQRINATVFYTTCLGPQGEMAQDCFNQEFDTVLESTFEDYVPEIYRNLVEDAERRGLEIPIQSQRIDIECQLVSSIPLDEAR